MGDVADMILDGTLCEGWRPKKAGTPWLFGIESYTVKIKEYVKK